MIDVCYVERTNESRIEFHAVSFLFDLEMDVSGVDVNFVTEGIPWLFMSVFV